MKSAAHMELLLWWLVGIHIPVAWLLVGGRETLTRPALAKTHTTFIWVDFDWEEVIRIACKSFWVMVASECFLEREGG